MAFDIMVFSDSFGEFAYFVFVNLGFDEFDCGVEENFKWRIK